jgi:hypothetical protein
MANDEVLQPLGKTEFDMPPDFCWGALYGDYIGIDQSVSRTKHFQSRDKIELFSKD